MKLPERFLLKNEQGFAFVAALLLTLLLVSLGILMFAMTTRDVRTTVRITGEKIALSNAETCIHMYVDRVRINQGIGLDGYSVTDFVLPGTGNVCSISVSNSTELKKVSGVIAAGYALNEGMMDTAMPAKVVTGRNTVLGSRVDVEIGVSYPVPSGPGYR
jgi:hypothetical protein